MCNTLTEIEIERRLDAAGGSKFGPPHQRTRRRDVRGSNSWPATVTARRYHYQTQQPRPFMIQVGTATDAAVRPSVTRPWRPSYVSFRLRVALPLFLYHTP